MDSKKSLGHFPFGPGSQGDSDYSFIPDLNKSKDVDVDPVEVEETDIFKSRPVENRKPDLAEDSESDDLQFIQIGSVKVKKTPQTQSFDKPNDSSQESPDSFLIEREILKTETPQKDSGVETKPSTASSKKKIVSYYLKEDLIERLKDYADSIKESYSAVAAAAFKEYLEKKEK